MYDEVRYRGRAVTVETGAEPPDRLVRLIRLLTRIHEPASAVLASVEGRE